jgi:hypothetical protein
MKKVKTIIMMGVLFSAITLIPKQDALAAPEKMKDGIYFDAEHYAENHPDVVAVFGKSKEALYGHYVRHGKAEGRAPHGMVKMEEFDAEHYASKHPDVVAVYGNTKERLYEHFTEHGHREKREHRKMEHGKAETVKAFSHKMATLDEFDAEHYGTAHKDVVAVYGKSKEKLYEHYTEHGFKEGRTHKQHIA